MPNINFPINPNSGDIYNFNGSNWRFNGTAWISILGVGPQGATGGGGVGSNLDFTFLIFDLSFLVYNNF